MTNNYKVVVSHLRVRSKPSIYDGVILGVLSEGEQITAVDRIETSATTWVKFDYHGKVAWSAVRSGSRVFMHQVEDSSSWYRFTESFTSPVGTEPERHSGDIWPGHWVDVNPYGTHYNLRKNKDGTWRTAWHTGADLNLNSPYWDSDRNAPIYAIGHGLIVHADWCRGWGNVIVIEHKTRDGKMVYSRYGHVGNMLVNDGELIKQGAQIGTIGQDAYGGPFHLHFDISMTDVLKHKPWDWPGNDRSRVYKDYIDPKDFLLSGH